MTQQMWQDIRSAFSRMDQMAEVRIPVISGRGAHLTSGIDLAMLAGLERADPGRLRWPFQGKAAPVRFSTCRTHSAASNAAAIRELAYTGRRIDAGEARQWSPGTFARPISGRNQVSMAWGSEFLKHIGFRAKGGLQWAEWGAGFSRVIVCANVRERP
jgi:hypothetical protein